jgi:ankyrin repeat protein
VGVIRAIVAKAAWLDVQDNNGRTPLHLAAQKGHAEVVNALLRAKDGDWVDRKNKSKCTALHDAVTANEVEAARVLVEYGASMSCQTYPGYTSTSPLAQAVRGRRAEIVQLFIAKGATPDEKVHGNIVLDAIEAGDLPTIKALLSADSKNSPTGKPCYATQNIRHAIQRNKVDVIKLLLELGADITDGEAFILALRYDHWMDVAGLLYNHSRSALIPFVTETYLKAAAANNVKTIRFWLRNGIPIDVKNKDGNTALHTAAAKGAVQALAALLEANSTGEFVNNRSNTGATAMFAAIDTAKRSNPQRTLKIIKLLVQHGANHHLGVNVISATRGDVSTPRGLALLFGLSDIVSYFDELEGKTGELGSELEAGA